MIPEIGDTIAVEWPGEDGLVEFTIDIIREAEDGTLCAVFGRDGIVGAEAISDLYLVDGLWVVEG